MINSNYHKQPKKVLLDKSIESFYWANEKLLDANTSHLARDYLKFKKIVYGYGIHVDIKSKEVISYFRYGQEYEDSKKITFDELPNHIKTHILLMGYIT